MLSRRRGVELEGEGEGNEKSKDKTHMKHLEIFEGKDLNWNCGELVAGELTRHEPKYVEFEQ